jgi:hypothetical protein
MSNSCAKATFAKVNNKLVNFDKNQLYSNLYTKLDLNELNGKVPVIGDVATNSFPSAVCINTLPYLTYNIDPYGVLFGNSVCGINNYRNFVVYNKNSSN